MTLARLPLHALTLITAVAAASFVNPVAAQGTGPAKATIMDSAGKTLGTLTLADSPKGLTIKGNLKGLSVGVHGIHIHAVGKCDAPTFASASSHFNPTGKQHGSENPMGPHVGDLKNITAESNGNATVDLTDKDATLAAILGANGAALVIHAQADDYKTDPSGNSGGRVACGVIKR